MFLFLRALLCLLFFFDCHCTLYSNVVLTMPCTNPCTSIRVISCFVLYFANPSFVWSKTCFFLPLRSTINRKRSSHFCFIKWHLRMWSLNQSIFTLLEVWAWLLILFWVPFIWLCLYTVYCVLILTREVFELIEFGIASCYFFFHCVNHCIKRVKNIIHFLIP